MSTSFTKITSEDLQNKGVVGLPDTPNLNAQDMQSKFDEIATDVIVPKFNNLVDELDEHVGDAIQSENVTNIKLSVDNTIQVSEDGGETYHDTASSGHIIMNGSGASYAQRSRLQFSSNAIITDDDEQGITFVQIPSGQKGDKGDTATIHVGSVVKGENASVVNSGSDTDAIFNFVLPQGESGNAATIAVGTVISGTTASVQNRGTSSSAIFDFVLPKGDKGESAEFIVSGMYETYADLIAAHPTGQRGDAYFVGDYESNVVYAWDTDSSSWKNVGALQGAKGDDGEAATVSVGTVTSGQTASVTNVGTTTNAVFDFVLPKGDTGSQGSAATIAVGNVTKGDTPSVTNSGTTSSAVFDFVLPKGDKGDKGDPSVINGKTGENITIYPSDMYLVGYSKPASSSAIATTDNITEAIGKLEKAHDEMNADSVHVSSQSLTQAQRKQARENIGVEQTHVYTIPSSAWRATTSADMTALNAKLTEEFGVQTSVDETELPYMAEISCTDFTDDTKTICEFPKITEDNLKLRAIVYYVYFTDTAIVLYATEEPTVSGVLSVKGE